MNIKAGYTFDDVLLVPKYSDIDSRSNVDLTTHLGKGVKLTIPVVSANMKNVTEFHMALAIAELGGLGIIHRFWDHAYNMVAHVQDVLRRTKDLGWLPNVGASVGVQDRDFEVVDQLVEVGCKIVCVDVAHGHHIKAMEMTTRIAKKYPHVLLIAGNIATKNGALALVGSGADVIKVGVGGGSLCTTRIETGNGVPQLTALMNVYEAHQKVQFAMIADGGIRRAGDIVKALCFSEAVMLGNVLAGTDEAPGTVITIDNSKYKEYAGSSTYKTSHVEGITGLVPCKGPVKPIIRRLMEGVRSGLSYQGANNLVELRSDPQFVTITNAGLTESHPHDVMKR